jgi:PleD family two-component response regulator
MTTTNTSTPPGTILIVEDNPKNVQVLGTILMDAKYRVAVAHQGSAVFDMLPKVKPDLILLDIMMPEMDGFEVCSRLKADANYRDIPVIFLTAKTETEDIVKGFDLGGSDFITKPFRAKELLARVQTHLALQRLQQNLKRKNQELEEALSNVKTLSGLLPICSYCKKIRNATGGWEWVEVFIQNRTNANFSHGVCPDCLKEHFPEYQQPPKET